LKNNKNIIDYEEVATCTEYPLFNGWKRGWLLINVLSGGFIAVTSNYLTETKEEVSS